jgi:hypothetical protein
VKYYWPNERSNIDGWIIGSYLWILLGILLGATSIRRKKASGAASYFRLRFGNFINYCLMLVIAFIIIHRTNLNIIRADGFYKFCFSLDVAAEGVIRNETSFSMEDRLKNAYMIRLNSIPFYQKSLTYAPQEKVYLNGAGRNFLELVKYRDQLERAKILQPQPDAFRSQAMESILRLDIDKVLERTEINRVNQAVNDILKVPLEQWNKFSSRDIFRCCYAVIMRSYQLDPENLERIIALARVFRFWGQVEHDKTRFETALKIYQLAKKASPLNTNTRKEEEETIRTLEQFKFR